MDETVSIFICWQFGVAAATVFMIVALFNGLKGWKGIGHYLWRLGSKPKLKWIRKFLKFMEAVKVPVMALLGFGLGWLPNFPRPEPLQEASPLAVALVYMMAGLFSVAIVKAVKKKLEAQGIDIDLDLDPKEQKQRRNGI